MSSKITQEKYDLVKIERLKHYLESSHQKGRPKFYEVFVDNLKAVDKTSDPEAFDEYLVYMGEDTRMVKVLIYTSTEACPRNDKFLFTLTPNDKDEKRRGELCGIEIEEKIHTVVQQERDKMNAELLKKEIERLEADLEETEQYVEELEKKLEETKNTKATAKENFGEVVSLALESMIRRNTHLLSGIPLLGQGLVGVVEQDNKRLEESALNSASAIEMRAVTFRRVVGDEETLSAKGVAISKEDGETLAYFQSLREAFTESELLKVFDIISALSQDKENISEVLDLLMDEDVDAHTDTSTAPSPNDFTVAGNY